MKRSERRLKFLVVCIFVATALPVLGADILLPRGWRMPTNQELGDDWRNKDAKRFATATGDFNGDGKRDHAMLLVPVRGEGIGLFVFLSQKDNTLKAYRVDVIKDALSINAMGIRRVSSGQYKTACGKGYWDCGKGEVPEIRVEHDAVDYFKTESANSFFYWDKQAQAFKRAWMSD